MAWRLIDDEPAAASPDARISPGSATGTSEPAIVRRPGAENMAVDHALLESVAAGAPPGLRFYAWAPPCLSLGRNQALSHRTRDLVRAARVDVVRRATGGDAVLHDQELTYAVVVPVGLLGSPRETYARINACLAAGLRRLGVPAAVHDGAMSPTAVPVQMATGMGRSRPTRTVPSGVCFAAAAPGEVVVRGRKLVGSAQRRERRALLQHGSLLLSGAQTRVAELLGEAAPVASGRSAPITLAEVLDRSWSEDALVGALVAGFREVLGIQFARTGLSESERSRAVDLATRYRSEEWLARGNGGGRSERARTLPQGGGS